MATILLKSAARIQAKHELYFLSDIQDTCREKDSHDISDPLTFLSRF